MLLCIELEKSELSTGPRVSSKNMKKEILDVGFDIVDVLYPETKLANQSVYIVVAQKNK